MNEEIGLKPKISIYLAGSIQKGHEPPNDCFWTQKDMDVLQEHLSDYAITFLNPALRADDLSNQRSTFGRDMLQVFCSDIVFADVRNRRGLGVGAEMMWAKLHKIPLVVWAPKNSHYHKSTATVLNVTVENWVHPFVESLADKVAENLREGAEWIRTFMTNPPPIKDLDTITSAMRYYRESQLHRDHFMQDLIKESEGLQKKVESLREHSLNR
jgi:hypothetical protein